MSSKVDVVIRKRIADVADVLGELSSQIHSHPETSFQEHFAHDQYMSVLKQLDFDVVTPHYADIDTAFRAEARSSDYDASRHATVAFCAEYDALPGIGHACGHNLIGEASLGAFVGLAEALAKGDVSGRAVLLGTPAEEGGGGKIRLIESGAFRDVDFAMMAHGGPFDSIYSVALSATVRDCIFTGRAAHASVNPWGGLNALDACVAAYVNLSMMRQATKPTCRFHAVITDGGRKPNIIPERAVLRIEYRARTVKDRDVLEARAYQAIKAAADAHGCQVEIKSDGSPDYRPLFHNTTLASVYQKCEEAAGVKIMRDDELMTILCYSTDMGDVSLTVPSIHPIFMPGRKAFGVMTHTDEFRKCAGDEGGAEAQAATLRVAGSLASAAAEVLADGDLLRRMKEEFSAGLSKYA